VNFFDSFPKYTLTSNFIEMRPVAAELLQTDRHDDADSRFSQFCQRA